MLELNVRFLDNFRSKFRSISNSLSQHFSTRLRQFDMLNSSHLISNTSCRMIGLCYLVCKFYFGKIEVFWRCVIIIAQIAFVFIYKYLHLQCIFLCSLRKSIVMHTVLNWQDWNLHDPFKQYRRMIKPIPWKLHKCIVNLIHCQLLFDQL